jgi:hypothetical protein
MLLFLTRSDDVEWEWQPLSSLDHDVSTVLRLFRMNLWMLTSCSWQFIDVAPYSSLVLV